MNQPNNTLSGSAAIVTGASRGFGRGIAAALAAAGTRVVGVARGAAQLDALRGEFADFTAVTADAADPATARRLIDEYRPRTIVLCAGAAPKMSPLQDQTWESFSQNWNVDVAQAFHWIRYALQRPLTPGSTVIAVSSGAAINGSPLSGGYAGAKATVRFITTYAALESERAGLGIEFVSVLPGLTPSTELGAKAVAAYAKRQGVDVEEFVQSMQPALTAEQVGKSVLEIATGEQRHHRAYTLSAAGLSALG
jgi:NAD(P)-dependent dehydrogenase (short-subunit alcohol dehydrogenase family)